MNKNKKMKLDVPTGEQWYTSICADIMHHYLTRDIAVSDSDRIVRYLDSWTSRCDDLILYHDQTHFMPHTDEPHFDRNLTAFRLRCGDAGTTRRMMKLILELVSRNVFGLRVFATVDGGDRTWREAYFKPKMK